ncbi:MAG: TfoX/Sxy family DNA transformation protein [Myxococcota bacterium]
MARVTALPNIGARVGRALEAVGLGSEEDLRGVGALEAYRRLCAAANRTLPRRPYLYGLDAALSGIPLSDLPVRRRVLLSREALGLPAGGLVIDSRPQVVIRSRGGRRRKSRR